MFTALLIEEVITFLHRHWKTVLYNPSNDMPPRLLEDHIHSITKNSLFRLQNCFFSLTLASSHSKTAFRHFNFIYSTFSAIKRASRLFNASIFPPHSLPSSNNAQFQLSASYPSSVLLRAITRPMNPTWV
jgi:hypothetical protein